MFQINPTYIRWLAGIALTGALSLAVISTMDLPLVGVDDANILFVYSKHLAEGHGLVYNIGSERVEGYSSALWMLLTAAGFALMDQPAPIFFTLNILLLAFALAYGSRAIDTAVLADAERPIWLPATATLLWLAWILSNPDFYIWTTTSLMETGLWTTLLLCTFWFMLVLIRQEKITGRSLAGYAILNALLLLTRPESMAWSLYFLAMLAVILRARSISWPLLLKYWLPVATGAAACLALLIAFRLFYFGYPLPNTYYAKMAPDRLYEIGWGLVYLREFVMANPVAGVFIVIAAFEFLRLTPGILRTCFQNHLLTDTELMRFSAASAALAGIVIPVLMGGDIFGAFRFFQPVWPLLILPALLLPVAQHLRRVGIAGSALLGIAALCVFTLAQSNRWTNLSEDRERVAHLYELTNRGILTGQYVQEIFPARSVAELPSIGASAAGGYKMGYPGQVIDTMGLNFTPMAHHAGDKRGTRGHAAFNKDVFWKYATDLVEPTLCPARGDPVNRANDPDNWLFQIYREIFADPRFISAYEYVAVKAPESGGWLCSYIKRDLVAQLRTREGIEFRPVAD